MKNIILILPIHFEIYAPIIKNLEKAGFSIEFFYLTDSPFRYKNIFQRMDNFFRKVFLGDKTNKQRIKNERENYAVLDLLKKVEKKVDYTLIIRPEFFKKETLLQIKKKTDKLFAYQWDSINRFPEVKKVIPLFDTFYVFDHNDVSKYNSIFNNLQFTPNFYLDIFPTDIQSRKEIFFLGSFSENRIHAIIKFAEFAHSQGIKSNINLYYSKKETPLQYPSPYINYTQKKSTYSEMISSVQKSDFLFDVLESVNNGLSFRIFEALYFQKKIITNNPLVKKYDFYNENNFFVFENENFDGLEDFFKSPYQKLPTEIIEKYSFTNWIHEVFHEEK